MASIFSKIIAGEIPSYKIAETKDYYAFLDIRPLTRGHSLIVPRQETDYLFDLDNETYAGLMLFSKIVAEAIKKAIPCNRVGVCVLGLEVPHAHIHLVPFDTMDQMNFANPKLNLDPHEMEQIAASIAAFLKH